MKNFILFFTLFFSIASAQDALVFNKSFIEAENNWVAFPKTTDSSYNFGFIYLDLTAGLTLQLGGKFRIDSEGKFVAENASKMTNTKIRLPASNTKVAIIPKPKLLELNANPHPEWLKHYKIDDTSTQNLFRLGYIYNEYGDCEKAANYLEKARNLNPKFNGLNPELAFSYNCLKRYDKAIAILKEDVLQNPQNAYIHKELSYAYLKNGDLLNAEKTFYKSVQNCTDQSFLGETSYNILHHYYESKDLTNFKHWLSTAKKYNSDSKEMLVNIKIMEDNFPK